MEDMFSLGNVGLWRMASNGYISLTGEVGELFITQILGTAILKLKYKDIVMRFQEEQMKNSLECKHRKVNGFSFSITSTN